MKKLSMCCCFVLLALSSFAADVAATGPLTHPDTTGWQELFAPDLSNAIKPDGVWTFENGELTASKDEAIWSQKEYENFVLDLEFKTAEETNSGVIVYCSDVKDWIPNAAPSSATCPPPRAWSRSRENGTTSRSVAWASILMSP